MKFITATLFNVVASLFLYAMYEQHEFKPAYLIFGGVFIGIIQSAILSYKN